MYNSDIDVIIPNVFINEDISEGKYDIIRYYGGSIVNTLTSVLALAVEDIMHKRFRYWWPNDEEILNHYDTYMSHVHTALYNAWNLVTTSGNDMRRIEWDVVEKIYRDLTIRLWRRYINVAWETVKYCTNVAFSETGNVPQSGFYITLVGIAVDDKNGLFFARYNVRQL